MLQVVPAAEAAKRKSNIEQAHEANQVGTFDENARIAAEKLR